MIRMGLMRLSVVLAVTSCGGSFAPAQEIVPRIINGDPAEEGEFAFVEDEGDFGEFTEDLGDFEVFEEQPPEKRPPPQ